MSQTTRLKRITVTTIGTSLSLPRTLFNTLRNQRQLLKSAYLVTHLLQETPTGAAERAAVVRIPASAMAVAVVPAKIQGARGGNLPLF